MGAIRSGKFVPAHPDCVYERKSGIKIDRIVLHTMEGTLAGTVAFFQQGWEQRKVPTAAHYCIGRLGDVVQMVDDRKKALHAGNYNSRSIGIEHEARIDSWPTSIRRPPFAVGEFPETMLAASAEVTRILCVKFGVPADREHIVGHNEVPGSTHRDPGSGWPWDAYMALVTATTT